MKMFDVMKDLFGQLSEWFSQTLFSLTFSLRTTDKFTVKTWLFILAVSLTFPAYARLDFSCLKSKLSRFISSPTKIELAYHPVLSKADSFDSFFKSPELQEEYFKYLENLYGPDKFKRAQFNAIMKQVKAVSSKIPEMKSRLWELPITEKAFFIEGKLKTTGRSLNEKLWDEYLTSLTNDLKAKAQRLLDTNESERKIQIELVVKGFSEILSHP